MFFKFILYASIYCFTVKVFLQGCRQLFRTGGANRVKQKELQFSSKGRVWEGGPPARSAEANFFFKIQEV